MLLYRDEEVAREEISVKVPERRSGVQLVRGNPSVRFAQAPVEGRKALNRFPEVLGGHWVSVNANVLSEQARQGRKRVAIKFAVAVFERPDHE